MKKSDYIRLNLKKVQDLPTMLVEKSKEFFDINIYDLSIRVSFQNVSCSHNAPIGKKSNWGGRDKNLPRNYLGWHGQIFCGVFSDNKECLERWPYSHHSAASELFNKNYKDIGFSGFHTGTGCPGSILDMYKMNIEFYFFLEDFPLLRSTHDQWDLLKNFENNKSDWNSKSLRCGHFVGKDHI